MSDTTHISLHFAYSLSDIDCSELTWLKFGKYIWTFTYHSICFNKWETGPEVMLFKYSINVFVSSHVDSRRCPIFPSCICFYPDDIYEIISGQILQVWLAKWWANQSGYCNWLASEKPISVEQRCSLEFAVRFSLRLPRILQVKEEEKKYLEVTARSRGDNCLLLEETTTNQGYYKLTYWAATSRSRALMQLPVPLWILAISLATTCTPKTQSFFAYCLRISHKNPCSCPC